jgi:multicomponent Na+:H+ antiporter subunit G
MTVIADVLSALLVLIGLLLTGVSGLALLRLPDAYSRMNAAGKASGLGVVFVITGSALMTADLAAGAKALVAIALQLISVPIGTYAIARAAYRAGTPQDPRIAYDELAQDNGGASQGSKDPAP